jgi:hypothetical protein
LAAVSAPVLWLPLVVTAPDQPPVAVQLVALVEDQLSVAAEPLFTVPGLAVSVTVGGAIAAVTWIEKAGNEADEVPSLTLMTIPE